MKKLFLVGLLAVAAANASITPDLLVTAGPTYCADTGPACTFTYSASLPNEPGVDHRVQVNDFFTIYDFGGFVGNIQSPVGWSGAATVATSVTVPGTSPVNDLTIINLTWTYVGGAGANPDGPWTGFSADSTFRFARPDGWYNSQAHKNSSGFPNSYFEDAKVGRVPVPASEGGEGQIPEPMSMALLGSGLTALGVLRMRKK